MLSFFYPVLQALEEGKVIRYTIALALQITGVLIILAGIDAIIRIVKFSFRQETTGATIGGLLLAAFVFAAVACICQVYFYRARSIKDLGDTPFTVIPIFSFLLRTVGETYATASIVLGIGGCLFVWLTQMNPLEILGPLAQIVPSFSSTGHFLDGAKLALYFFLSGLAVLILFYFFAEAVVVASDIARNVRLLTRDPVPAYPKATALRKCTSCGNATSGDSVFCDACGVSVKGQPA